MHGLDHVAAGHWSLFQRRRHTGDDLCNGPASGMTELGVIPDPALHLLCIGWFLGQHHLHLLPIGCQQRPGSAWADHACRSDHGRHVAAGLTTSQLAYGATRSLEDIVASWGFYPDWEYSSHDVWNFAVGETFLEPFGLFDKSQAASHPENWPATPWHQATLDEIRKCNPDLVNHPFFLPRPGPAVSDHQFLLSAAGIRPGSKRVAAISSTPADRWPILQEQHFKARTLAVDSSNLSRFAGCSLQPRLTPTVALDGA